MALTDSQRNKLIDIEVAELARVISWNEFKQIYQSITNEEKDEFVKVFLDSNSVIVKRKINEIMRPKAKANVAAFEESGTLPINWVFNRNIVRSQDKG